MLELARPGFLLAGALLALVPPVLHLITRRPPERAQLPTVRFLRPDPRTRVRLRRRPSDPLLLALRSAWLLLLGAGLAGPSWMPRRSGTVELLLLDRGAGMADAWGAALDSARAVPFDELIVFDTAAERIAGGGAGSAVLDSLAAAGPGAAPVDYAVALRSIAGAIGDRSDSVRVTLATRPRWEGWSAGFGKLRRALYPGSVRLISLPGSVGPGAGDIAPDTVRRGRAVVVARDDEGVYAAAALEAAGWEVVRRTPAEFSAGVAEIEVRARDAGAGDSRAAGPDGAMAGLFLVLAPVDSDGGAMLHDEARRGATVVVDGAALAGGLGVASDGASDGWTGGLSGPQGGSAGGPLAASLPWRSDRVTSATVGADVRRGGAIVFGPDLAVDGAADRASGVAAPRARVVAVWDDGAPAAAAAREGDGCVVVVGTTLEAGRLPRSSAFPAMVDRLTRGCDPAPSASSPGAPATPVAGVRDGRSLDAGARRVLVAPDAPSVVAAAAVAAAVSGHPLGRWLLAAALGVALVETLLAYRRSGGR